MNTVRIYPKAGQRVMHPGSRRPLDADGEELELSTYWRRRLDEGVCTLQAPASAPSSTPPAPLVLRPDPVRLAGSPIAPEES